MTDQFILTPFFLDRHSPELEFLAQAGWLVNRPVLPTDTQQARMSAYHRPLADLTAATLARRERPVCIAGDCCAPIGFLAGLQRAGLHPALLWLDAHGDFNTWETTPSGFLGGMPLAMLVGRGDQSMPQAVGLRPLAEASVVLCDGRDLDPGEKLALSASQVVHLQDTQALPRHPLLQRPVYVHLDTDIINPSDAPAMGYLAQGGPSAAELKEVFRTLAKSGQVSAVSVSTWRPDLDRDGRTRTVCLDLLTTLLS